MGLLNFPFPRGVIQRVPDPSATLSECSLSSVARSRIAFCDSESCKAGSAEAPAGAAAKASKQSPPLPPAPGGYRPPPEPDPSMVSGCVNSGSTPARTSELFPEPLAPTTSTNGRCALTCASKASNTSPIAFVLWKIGACSKSKKSTRGTDRISSGALSCPRPCVRSPVPPEPTKSAGNVPERAPQTPAGRDSCCTLRRSFPRCSFPNAQRTPVRFHCRIKTSHSSFGSNGGVGFEQLR